MEKDEAMTIPTTLKESNKFNVLNTLPKVTHTLINLLNILPKVFELLMSVLLTSQQAILGNDNKKAETFAPAFS
ncbi:hypothetical protein LV84_03027 [Algoriphagus ratkowskyi]|uniref:Uncharacterized protein n=1 Tax=Algoriphagus ratkowskyi TaxID=57028 RepID=A0A2W7RHU6_9BACT|nr:hypothetical protein [Algoriphagus ratkowskyi]PZX53919.1 hypothetical protein LV84_03027 [Algoriphagus ratkowskyi]